MKDPYQIIHLIGAVQGVFLFLLLVMRKENKTANKILAFMILLISVNLTTSFFHTNNDSIMDLPAINRSDVFIYLYGPLIAAYTAFLTGYAKKVSIKQAMQLMPGLCLLFLLLENKYGNIPVLWDIWDETNPVVARLWFVIHFTALFHLLSYIIHSLRLVYRYDSKLKAFFSNTGRIYLLWLRVLLTSIILICFIAITQFVAYNFGNTEGPLQWAISTAIVILVYMIGFYTNKQPDILEDIEFIDGTLRQAENIEASERAEMTALSGPVKIPAAPGTPESTDMPESTVRPESTDMPEPTVMRESTVTPKSTVRLKSTDMPAVLPAVGSAEESDTENSAKAENSVTDAKTKYERSRLSEEAEKSFLDRLVNFVGKNKPYLDPDLDLRQLSEMSGIPSHMISMLLNIRLNRNFYTFINGYRVGEAKRLLSSDSSKESNILTIAYDSGFNSKSTFNMVFRKLEGMTPSEFRSKYISNLSQSHNNFV